MLYISILLATLLLAYIAEKREKKRYVFLIALMLSLFCGMRGVGTGVDTLNYYNLLRNIRYSGPTFGSDIGFSILSYAFLKILEDEDYVLMLYAFVTQFLISFRLWDFKKEASLPLMFFVYMAFYYSYTFNIVRQFIAMAIVFWGTRYIERSESWKHILLNAIASTIHTSSLLGFSFLLIDFSYVTKKKRSKIFSYMAAVAFGLVGASLFTDNITKYGGYFTSASLTVHALTIAKILAFLIIFFANKPLNNTMYSLSKSGQYLCIQRQNVIFYGFGLLLSSLGMAFIFMNRIGMYFMMFEMPFWGQTVRVGKNKGVYQAFIIAIYVFVIGSMIFSGDNPGNLYYYHSFLAE